jgi:GT2 family glycosyltransferase
MQTSPSDSIWAVVVHHRTPRQTPLAVRALLASDRPPDAVIVVNNDSRPAEPELHDLAHAPNVLLIETGHNRGFPGGANAGIRAARSRGAHAVLLVNSDLRVEAGCLGALETACVTAPHAAIAGPLVVRADDPQRVESWGIAYHRQTGRMRLRSHGARADAVARARVEEVDAIAGCLMLIRCEVFAAIGLLDEAFFFGFEDLEYCLRARAAGFRTVVAGAAVARHHGGLTIGPSPRRLYFAARNHLLLNRRVSRDEAAAVRVARAASILALNGVHALTADGGSVRSRLAAVARGAVDYMAGRFGAGPEGAG